MLLWLTEPLIASAIAGPWVHPPGAGYTKLSFRDAIAESAEGSDLHNRCSALSLYGERGLLPQVELLFDLPYLSCSNRFGDSALSYRSQGLGTARLGAGLTAPGLDLPLALQVLARIPMASGGGTSLHPPLGDSQIDLDLLLSAGASAPLGAHRVWTIAEAGLRRRTDLRPVAGIGYPGFELLYRAQVGLLPGELGWVQLEALGQEDLRGGRAAHQVGVGLAAALFAGLHAEAGVQRVYLARGGGPGFGWTVGISHIRSP